MKITKLVQLDDVEVEVPIGIDDIVTAMNEPTTTRESVQRGISNCYIYLKAIPEHQISLMSDSARELVITRFTEQLARFKR